MKKNELIDVVSDKAGLSKADTKRALDALTESIQETLTNGDKVALVGFGTWSCSQRSARTGRNPATGEAIQIPASTGVKFSAGAALKKAIN